MSVSIAKMCLKETVVTPGPYRLVASKCFTFEIRGKGNKLIAWTMDTADVCHEEALANARLIVKSFRDAAKKARL